MGAAKTKKAAWADKLSAESKDGIGKETGKVARAGILF
jgi:hypothetical protein